MSAIYDDDNLLRIDKEGAIKTLGFLWDAKLDALQYDITVEDISRITKRLVLSKLAQIYPLGPVVIVAKCIIQSMWQTKTEWNEILPQEMQKKWIQFYRSLFFT